MISSCRILGLAALTQGELSDAEAELTPNLRQARRRLGTAHKETVAMEEEKPQAKKFHRN